MTYNQANTQREAQQCKHAFAATAVVPTAVVPVPGDLLRVRQPANTPQHNANAGTLATMQGMQCLSYSVSASCQNSSLRQLHSALTSRPSCHKHAGWRVRVAGANGCQLLLELLLQC